MHIYTLAVILLSIGYHGGTYVSVVEKINCSLLQNNDCIGGMLLNYSMGGTEFVERIVKE